MDTASSMASPATAELLAQRAWLHELAACLVRDEAERDDLVQETWLAALERPPQGELRPWLATVLRNRWRFARRTRARRGDRELERGEARLAPSAAELAEQAELQGVLVRAVLALEEPYRSTVLLRYFGERSSAAIAAQEGVPEGTVRSRLKRALDQLRDELDRANGGERRRWALALVPLARLARGSAGSAAMGWATAGVLVLLVACWSLLRQRGTELSGAEIARAESATAAPELVHAASALPERASLAGEAVSAATTAPFVAGARLELLVLDPDSRPIAGARVAVSNATNDTGFEAASDELGRFRLPDAIWTSKYLNVRVEAEGFVHHHETLSRGSFSWSSLVALYLPRATVLEGRLTDRDTARPIEGVELRLLHSFCEQPLARATSAGDGSFRLENAPRGHEVELVLRSPRYPLTQRIVQISSSASAPLELALSAGIELRGRVVDAWSGAPLEGVRAFYERNWYGGSPADGALELARSDASGELRLRRGAEGEREVLFVRPGYCSLRLSPSRDDFEVAMLPVAVVEGVLRDDAGRTLEGGTVTLGGRWSLTWPSKLTLVAAPTSPFTRLSPDDPLFIPEVSTRTDEHGRFRIEVVPGLADSSLIATAPQGSRVETLGTPLQPGETARIEVALPSSGTITGVLRINGEPGPGVVKCFRAGKVLAIGWAGVDGAFEVHGVAPGRVVLRACPDELEQVYQRTGPDLAEVEVVPGEAVAVTLDVELALGTIRGRVASASGEPSPFVQVVAGDRSLHGMWSTLTDARGAFEVRLPADLGEVPLSLDGSIVARARVGAEAVELQSKSYGRLRLHARDPEGRTLDRVTLFSRRAADAWDWHGEYSTGADGFAEWQLETGTLELAVCHAREGFAPLFFGRHAVSESSDLELSIVLELVSETRFVLTNPPMPGVTAVQLERVDGQAVSDDDSFLQSFVSFAFRRGPASLAALADGDYLLRSSNPDVRIEPAEITLGSDRSRPIELTWSPAR